MKRSFLMSALVLGLVAAAPACGGSRTPDGKPPEGGNKPAEGNKDPVDELKELSDGIQKDVDDLLKPITDADEAITAVTNLPKELKATLKAGFKFDPKKLGAIAA